jgi:hypothetical protein
MRHPGVSRLLALGVMRAADVFATEAEADDPAQEAFDRWHVADEPHELDRGACLGEASELAGLLSLQGLCKTYRGFASPLQALEVRNGDGAASQRYCEVIGRGDGVGDRVISQDGRPGLEPAAVSPGISSSSHRPAEAVKDEV